MPADILDSLVQATILKPGDRVIFHFAEQLTMEQADHISRMIRGKMGADFPFVVISKGITTEVYSVANDD